MVVTLIVVCEVGFWVLLALGLALRYGAGMPRTGAAVLLCEPLLELVLFAVTAVDLRDGAVPDARHGLAAVYIGVTVAHGRSLVRWADGHARHRLAGGPPPARPPRYGMARARHEWAAALRAVVAALVAAALLEAAARYVGEPARSAPLRMWQLRVASLAGVWVLVAASYTVWPKRPTQRARPTPPSTPPQRPGRAVREEPADAPARGPDLRA